MDKIRVSLIVPISRKSQQSDLDSLAVSVAKQSNKNLEVLVLSDPDSKDLNRTIWNVPFRYFHSEKPGASNARNLGALKAFGEILAFVDDDIVLDERWCAELLSTFADLSIGVVSGCADISYPGVDLGWVPLEFNWVIGGSYWPYSKTSDVLGGAGMNFSVKSEVFAEVGGYNPRLGPMNDRPEHRDVMRLGGEESELALRILEKTKKRIVYNPNLKVVHRLRYSSLRPRGLVRRAIHVGHNRAYLRKRFDSRATRSSNYLVVRGLINSLFSRDLFIRPIVFWKRNSFCVVVVAATCLGFIFGEIEFLLHS